MTMTIKKQKTTLLLPVFALAMLTACSSNEKKDKTLLNSDSAIAVTIATPVMNEGNTISISGQVESSQTANISTRVMGYITKLTVKVGDHVKA